MSITLKYCCIAAGLGVSLGLVVKNTKMAIQEYETQSVSEEEPSRFDYFKDGLHRMVNETEEGGDSALNSLLTVREELRQRRMDLMRQSALVEQRLRDDQDWHNIDLINELAALQEELVLIYHQQVWTEGYIRDRQQA